MKQLEVPRPGRRFAMQWKPNLIRRERRLVLTRLYWNRGNPGIGAPKNHSNKLSISLCWNWRHLFVGFRITPELWGFILWIHIPFLSIRIHKKRAYGGSFI